MNSIGRLLTCIDLERLEVLIDQLSVGDISELIILIPHGSATDKKMPTCVSSWEQVASVARADNTNFFPIQIHEAISSKLKGIW